MSFGSRTVAQRDVQFNVNLGQFRAELGEAQAVYARSTGAMSTEALKLSVAEERLSRAIKQHGASSLQARSATVALRKETEQLGAAATFSRDRLLSEERAMGRFTRGAIEGSGAAKGLGRSLAFSSAAFLGSAGLVYAIRASVKAAEDHQVSLGNLQNALRDSGISWQQYGRSIQAALDVQVKQTAFTNDELTVSLGVFVRRFGDVNKALQANAIAADVARAKNEDLAAAQKTLLRASTGSPQASRTLGIAPIQKVTAATDALRAVTKHATAEQVANAKAADQQATATKTLAAVQAAYHGAAARFLQTTTGKQRLLNAELKTSEEIIGQALLPVIAHLSVKVADYLSKLNRTGKLEKDVHRVTHDLGVAFHDAGVAVHGVKEIMTGLAPLFHGIGNEVKLLTAALLLFKINGVAAFKTGAAEIEAAAVPLIAAETAAINGASIVDRISAYTAGGVPPAAGGLGTGGKLGGGGLILPGLASDTQPGGTPVKDGTIITQNGKKYVVHSNAAGRILAITAYDPNAPKPTPDRGFRDAKLGGNRFNAGRDGKGRGGGGGGLVLGLTNAQQTALLVAQGTTGTGDDVKALDDQLAIYNRLLAQKGLNAAQRNDLLSGRNAVEAQLQSISSAGTSAADSAARKAAAAKRKAAAAAAKAERERQRKRALLIRGLEQAPVGLRTQVEAALANNAGEDKLLALYRKERAAIEHQIVELRKINAGKEAILRARTSEAAIEKHILSITKKKTKTSAGGFAALEREFLAGIQNLAQDRGNLFGTAVTVNQHFPNPPTSDGHREAIFAHHAASAVFDG